MGRREERKLRQGISELEEGVGIIPRHNGRAAAKDELQHGQEVDIDVDPAAIAIYTLAAAATVVNPPNPM